MLLLAISFIAGALTVLAPCILPLLPVIVGRSLTDPTVSRRRALVVILSLGISVVLFTLILKVSTLFLNVPQNFWTWLSGSIIFIFGLIMIFPSLWESLPFTSSINRKSNVVLMQGYQKNNFWGDVAVGASLGPIFSACSPTYFVILATVLPVKPLTGIIYLLVYALGLCLSLLLVVLAGQRLMKKLNLAADSHGWFKKIFGIIFILVAVAIVTGYDKKFQISILNSGFLDVTKIEQKLLDQDAKTNSPSAPTENTTDSSAPKEKKAKSQNFLTIAEKSKKFPLAPDISTPDGFINTNGKPITVGEFKGKKVVLLDIWTYSCINCQRTIPYLNEWYKKYEDKGLVIIGLQTPEFSFERIQKNVENAVENFGIKYPVVLDNDFSTWQAYKNQYWPRKYLIDIDGYIVYDHAGEGEYDVTELKIQNALAERNQRLGIESKMPEGIVNPTDKVIVEQGKIRSPEVYFGSARNEYLANGKQGVAGSQTLTAPEAIKSNQLYLGGEWLFAPEYSQNEGDGKILFKYNAKNVYMVASSTSGADIEVYVDEKLINTIFIKDEKLYNIVKGADYGEHTLKIKIKKPGLKAFTFTFG